MSTRIQRRRTKGWRMPEGAIYVGRPSPYGNPFPIDYKGDVQPWLALALGERADLEGRRLAAVKAYRAWLTGGIPGLVDAIPTDDELPDTGGAIEYTSGAIRKMSSIPVGMGVMMLSRAPIVVPRVPDIEPLRGHDLVCWCRESCLVDVDLYGVPGSPADPCMKPLGHEGPHDPSVRYCHADVLLEVLAWTPPHVAETR